MLPSSGSKNSNILSGAVEPEAEGILEKLQSISSGAENPASEDVGFHHVLLQ